MHRNLLINCLADTHFKNMFSICFFFVPCCPWWAAVLWILWSKSQGCVNDEIIIAVDKQRQLWLWLKRWHIRLFSRLCAFPILFSSSAFHNFSFMSPFNAIFPGWLLCCVRLCQLTLDVIHLFSLSRFNYGLPSFLYFFAALVIWDVVQITSAKWLAAESLAGVTPGHLLFLQ